MQKRLILSLMILSLFACSKPEKNTVDPELEKTQIPEQHKKIENVQQGLTFEDIPNEETVYETIEANNIDENEVLMNIFQTQLLKDQFELFERESGNAWSENDCHLNKIIQVKGQGLRTYIAQSKLGVGEKKNIFPDFTLLVFGFDNEQQAIQHFTTLHSAVSSNNFCNGKTPEKIVRSQNEIFYFTTRAEMFRTYINRYADFIQQQ